MTGNSAMQMTKGRAWRAGLTNLLRKESHDWWGTRSWLVQSLIWLAILNGILLIVLHSGAAESEGPSTILPAGSLLTLQGLLGLTVFISMAGIALPIGAIIRTQDSIIGERQTGTAGWILSKPVSRSAFVLSKLLGDLPGIVVIMVLLQGIVAYIQLAVFAGSRLAILPYLGALGLVLLNILFYLALTIMLGTFFRVRGPVVGIGIILLFTYQILARVPGLAEIMPWRLASLSTETEQPMAIALATGQPISSWLPAIAAAVWIAAFGAVAIWRFSREEF